MWLLLCCEGGVGEIVGVGSGVCRKLGVVGKTLAVVETCVEPAVSELWESRLERRSGVEGCSG